MDKLPALSGKEVIRIFIKAGFVIHHQKGSHVVLKLNEAPFTRVVIPNHYNIKRGMLRWLIKEAGLSREEFMKLLD
jgi:predicted RNA binding protein YcfA (HicA-like mRNA interferase family)